MWVGCLWYIDNWYFIVLGKYGFDERNIIENFIYVKWYVFVKILYK